VLLKQEDIVLTDDAWHVTAELNVNPYEEAVLTIWNDVRVMYESKREFTSIAELRQIEVLLDTLETRIHNFRHLLPKPDNRRGLINIGGTALKALFRVATASDVMRLHQTIEELETKDADIIHSLENQMTYVKNLDLSSRLQTQSIANLSTVVKKFMIDSHDRFFETTRDILWLNLTVHSQSEVYMAVRQLEFALFQLTRQVDELLAAIQYALQGKLPITLIGPSVLHVIICNISFHLPEGYELMAGTKQQNIFVYYDLIAAAMVGDSQSEISNENTTENDRATLLPVRTHCPAHISSRREIRQIFTGISIFRPFAQSARLCAVVSSRHATMLQRKPEGLSRKHTVIRCSNA